jgi:SPP1 family predicted phage head-tail adaptor
MRNAVATTLPGTVIISRSTQGSDGMGGVTDTWANVGTVAARVSPAGAGIEMIAGGEFVAATGWVITVPVGTSVTERDRIIYDGQTYEITRTSTPRSYATCIRLDCNEVD